MAVVIVSGTIRFCLKPVMVPTLSSLTGLGGVRGSVVKEFKVLGP